MEEGMNETQGAWRPQPGFFYCHPTVTWGEWQDRMKAARCQETGNEQPAALTLVREDGEQAA